MPSRRLSALPLLVVALAAVGGFLAVVGLTRGAEAETPPAVPEPGAPATGAEAGAASRPPSKAETDLAAAAAALEAGRYDEAIARAKAVVRAEVPEAAKTEATRLVARAQRKARRWDLALAAYLTLRQRLPKGSEERIRVEAVIDVLRAARGGLYLPLVQSDPQFAGRTLDDDAVLEAALARLAKMRAERLQVRLTRLDRARTAPELVREFAALAAELRALRVIWPGRSPSLDRSAVQRAATRLQALSAPVLARLQAEAERLRRTPYNSNVRNMMLQYRASAANMEALERSFLDAAEQIGGTAEWPEGQKLLEAGAARREAYAHLVQALTPPGARRGGPPRDARRWDRGKGAPPL